MYWMSELPCFLIISNHDCQIPLSGHVNEAVNLTRMLYQMFLWNSKSVWAGSLMHHWYAIAVSALVARTRWDTIKPLQWMIAVVWMEFGSCREALLVLNSMAVQCKLNWFHRVMAGGKTVRGFALTIQGRVYPGREFCWIYGQTKINLRLFHKMSVVLKPGVSLQCFFCPEARMGDVHLVLSSSAAVAKLVCWGEWGSQVSDVWRYMV